MRFRKRSDQDFAEEIQAHLELETDRFTAGGMTPGDARAAAERAFGNRTAARERFHESRTWMPLEQLGQDCRYAGRSIRPSAWRANRGSVPWTGSWLGHDHPPNWVRWYSTIVSRISS